jgi:hypothetical protein
MDTIEIEKIINNLWSTTPEWVNYLAIDFGGFIFGFENRPHCDHTEQCWYPKLKAKNQNRICSISIINVEFPNWKNLIFERPLIITNLTDSPNNQLTPLLQRLRDYLDNTSREKIIQDWEQVKSRGLTGSPTAEEFIKSFKK